METILLMQRAFKRERVFRDRSQPLDFLNDVDLISRYRFPRRVLKELINVVDVTCRPAKIRSHSISTQAERYQREKHRDFHVRKRLKEKCANCYEWENYSLEELLRNNTGAGRCQIEKQRYPCPKTLERKMCNILMSEKIICLKNCSVEYQCHLCK